jgi:hypothetical protein
MYNPELALLEALRILRCEGQLVVGLYVEGGEEGKVRFKTRLKKHFGPTLRAFLGQLGDRHIWHPTYKELRDLVQVCGFTLDHVHWQKGYDNTVCYIRAIKSPTR